MHTHKVYSAWQRRREVPQIKLQGEWLARAGLAIGAGICVRIEGGRLVIEPADAPAATVMALPHSNPQRIAA